jgi:hypothetical protein
MNRVHSASPCQSQCGNKWPRGNIPGKREILPVWVTRNAANGVMMSHRAEVFSAYLFQIDPLAGVLAASLPRPVLPVSQPRRVFLLGARIPHRNDIPLRALHPCLAQTPRQNAGGPRFSPAPSIGRKPPRLAFPPQTGPRLGEVFVNPLTATCAW